MAGLTSQADQKLHLHSNSTQIENNNSLGTTTNKIPNSNTIDQNSQHSSEIKNNQDVDREPVCYNKALDDDIRNRLNKLNALSDLINSLERDFDEANSVFREISKCSTDRLSSIAKTLGNNSIRQGRMYIDAKLSVEQSQNDCQKACLQFEQANKDHQVAKEAIKEAELKLKQITSTPTTTNCVIQLPSVGKLDFDKLKLDHSVTLEVDFQDAGSSRESDTKISCETHTCDKDNSTNETQSPIESNCLNKEVSSDIDQTNVEDETIDNKSQNSQLAQSNSNKTSDNDASLRSDADKWATNILTNAALLSEELNLGIQKLIEAETNRALSERQHLNQANKLMIAQENLVKLKRDYGPAIRRSQLYFEEARRFKAKLNTIKLKIDRISENIAAAKQAYAQTLNELERFSDELHSRGATT